MQSPTHSKMAYVLKHNLLAQAWDNGRIFALRHGERGTRLRTCDSAPFLPSLPLVLSGDAPLLCGLLWLLGLITVFCSRLVVPGWTLTLSHLPFLPEFLLPRRPPSTPANGFERRIFHDKLPSVKVVVPGIGQRGCGVFCAREVHEGPSVIR